MATLINCSLIKEVHLFTNDKYLSLEVRYTNNEGKAMWEKDISKLAHSGYSKRIYQESYDTIKSALFEGVNFVEIEL